MEGQNDLVDEIYIASGQVDSCSHERSGFLLSHGTDVTALR